MTRPCDETPLISPRNSEDIQFLAKVLEVPRFRGDERTGSGRILRRLQPHLIRHRQRLVGAVEELDGVEDHVLVAEVFEIVDLVFARPVGLVPGLARLVGVFDGGAVHQVLAAAAAVHRGPEIVQHVAVEADPLARLEPDDPDPHLVGFGQQLGADAAVGAGGFRARIRP